MDDYYSYVPKFAQVKLLATTRTPDNDYFQYALELDGHEADHKRLLTEILNSDVPPSTISGKLGDEIFLDDYRVNGDFYKLKSLISHGREKIRVDAVFKESNLALDLMGIIKSYAEYKTIPEELPYLQIE